MKPVLFIDFDGTLCHDRFWRSVDVETSLKIQGFLFGEDRSILRGWMRGEYSAEDVHRILSEKLDIPFDSLWNAFVHECETMNVSADTLRFISTLREKYHTVLMTDNMDSLTRFTVPALDLYRYFDAIENSFENKRLKNDDNGKAFVDVAQRLGASIEQSILVDDSPATCETFTRLGGKAYLVTPEHPLLFLLTHHVKA